jgi:hypothetical protein
MTWGLPARADDGQATTGVAAIAAPAAPSSAPAELDLTLVLGREKRRYLASALGHGDPGGRERATSSLGLVYALTPILETGAGDSGGDNDDSGGDNDDSDGDDDAGQDDAGNGGDNDGNVEVEAGGSTVDFTLVLRPSGARFRAQAFDPQAAAAQSELNPSTTLYAISPAVEGVTAAAADAADADAKSARGGTGILAPPTASQSEVARLEPTTPKVALASPAAIAAPPLAAAAPVPAKGAVDSGGGGSMEPEEVASSATATAETAPAAAVVEGATQIVEQLERAHTVSSQPAPSASTGVLPTSCACGVDWMLRGVGALTGGRGGSEDARRSGGGAGSAPPGRARCAAVEDGPTGGEAGSRRRRGRGGGGGRGGECFHRVD